MKVLVVPHHLELGGVQTNAIDLATGVRDHSGHDVVFCATPGPAAEVIAERGFRLIELPRPKTSPSPTLARLVYRAARRENVDLVHAYDNQQIFDTFYGIHLLGRVPMMGTQMSMAVQRMLPRSIPLTYGTAALVDEARRWHHAPLWLLEPPVNTDRDSMAAVDPAGFRREWAIDDDAITIVVVSRLVSWLKADGLFRAVDAVGELAADRAVRLVVVGGGTLFDSLAERAAAVNAKVGRKVVVLTGPLVDPRPAYAAADIVIGMGGSILRGMSFEKPAIVLGENGFSEIFTPESAGLFLRIGFYGQGDHNASDLRGQLASLVDDPQRRATLARFARTSVDERYGLRASAAALDRMYRESVAWHASGRQQITDASATMTRRVAALLPTSLKATLKRSGRTAPATTGAQ